MEKLTLTQLRWVTQHRQQTPLHTRIAKEEFIFSFLHHLTEHYQQRQQPFRLLIPLLDPSLTPEQETVLAIDGVEVGELHLLFNSVFNSSSLVYYSPSGLMEVFLMDYEQYDTFTCGDYLVLLYEFIALLDSEKKLYEINPNQSLR